MSVTEDFRDLSSEVADIINMRNRHSPVFLMGTDVGRMLDHIAISLVHQAMQQWAMSVVHVRFQVGNGRKSSITDPRTWMNDSMIRSLSRICVARWLGGTSRWQ